MKWNGGETEYAKERRLRNWHRTFAWRPINVATTNDGRYVKVWLQWIERRLDHIYMWREIRWEYRMVQPRKASDI